jgi:predicted PurR-regulated permease PerM
VSSIGLKDRTVRTGITAWTIIGMVIIAYGAGWLFARIAPALTPFFMGAVIVLVLRMPVNRLEKRGMKRWAAVALCYVAALAVLGIFGAFVIPVVVSQLAQFFKDFPGYYDSVADIWADLQGRYAATVLPQWVQIGISDISQMVVGQFGNWGSALAGGVVSAGGMAAGFLFDSILALVVGFWALKDLPAVRGELMHLVGEHKRREAEMIIDQVLHVLGGYIRGQFLVSLVTGSLVAIGLAILGVPYALVLGLVTGLLNVIPYVGPFIGGLISAIVAAFISPWAALAAILITLAAQQLTDLFITPRVMSEQVDLHPLLVIFSLLVGGTLFGFWGLVLAIPVAAIGKGLFVYYYEKHTQREIASEQGVFFRTKKAEGPCPETTQAEESTE